MYTPTVNHLSRTRNNIFGATILATASLALAVFVVVAEFHSEASPQPGNLKPVSHGLFSVAVGK
jgi:hypothetical protein